MNGFFMLQIAIGLWLGVAVAAVWDRLQEWRHDRERARWWKEHIDDPPLNRDVWSEVVQEDCA